jgi:hypothetical protein
MQVLQVIQFGDQYPLLIPPKGGKKSLQLNDIFLKDANYRPHWGRWREATEGV